MCQNCKSQQSEQKLCAHSPSVHSYYFYIWHVSIDHWAFLYEYLLDLP